MRHRMCTELTGACHVLRPGIDRLHSENVMSKSIVVDAGAAADLRPAPIPPDWILNGTPEARSKELARSDDRSEEHTSELQSLAYLVCRLLLEKKKNSTVMSR